MMKMPFQLKSLWLAATLSGALCSDARASLITNGGFEAGFSNWTRSDQPGSDGTFALQTGTASPVNGDPVPAPPGGTTAAMTDAQGPGSHVLYQDFTVPSSAPAATLLFDVFIGNRAGMFASPNTLDFSTPTLNQQARVDILLASASPFSVASGDVLMNVFQTNPGDPAVSGYTMHSVDVSALFNAHLGETLRLRFAETDDIFTFQLGVDNVDFEVSAVPEPSYVMAVAGVLLGIGSVRCWRLKRRASRNIG
jgi:hypothetical protein